MSFEWLHTGSLVFGLMAWIFPFIQFPRNEKRNQWIVRSFLSLSACAISLCLQMFSISHQIKRQDWATLQDTAGAIIFAATILIVVTLTLIIVTLIANTE